VRELLLQKGVSVDERDYFKDRLTAQEIGNLAKDVGMSEIFAWRSPSFKKLGLIASEVTDEQMATLILEEPRLLKRPIVRIGEQLIIGGSLKAIEEAI
jgi:arsenate reductase-like glutaredoxin family protein|tara:strand:- start:108 stop:401 length:294 start_codon:yes stop_codon:yes gene_type:complete